MMNWLNCLLKQGSSGLLVAYHATIAGNQILAEGFKTRKQLSEFSALGGGTSDSISFTTDWAVAKGIFDAFIFAWNIANGHTTPKEIYYQSDPSLREHLKSMFKAVEGGYLEERLEGWKPVSVFGFSNKIKPLTAEQLQALGYKPASDVPATDGLYYLWLQPMNQKEYYDFLYNFLKAYYSAQTAAATDVYNPLFFGSNIKNFIGVDRNSIGILTAEIEIDPEKQGNDDFHQNKSTHRFVGSMAELRVYDLSTIKGILDFDPNPGNRPKHKSQNVYYNREEGPERVIGSLLEFIYSHYQPLYRLFKQKNISIDAVISMFQEYGHRPEKIYELLRGLDKALSLDMLKHCIESYTKYKSRIDIPKDITAILSQIPKEYQDRMFAGERPDDVLGTLYDNDKTTYDQWWTAQPDAYQSEKSLNSFFDDYKHNVRLYQAYGEPFKASINQFYQDEDIPLVGQLSKLLDGIKNTRWDIWR